MAHWLASPGDAGTFAHVKRFDPAYWTVNFPRPMMASAVRATLPDGRPDPHGVRVDCTFYRSDDLAGLIWEAEDRHDHPLLRYETARDFRQCVLSFGWTSGGLLPLDAVHGPTLTIEGRDAQGRPVSWYVRLWNYAKGTTKAATVRIDFAAVQGGFVLPAEAVPVWAGDVDRMFISLVPAGYTGAPGMLPRPAEAWATLSNIACEGAGSVLRVGDGQVPAHALRMATGYDDLYHLNPARVMRNMVRLGYGRVVNHYVGMSHCFRLEAAAGGELLASRGSGAINEPCARWHRAFAAEAKAAGFEIIWSLSYELLDGHCPAAWKQRSADGAPALTGWKPPSTLLSPAHEGAMAYLRAVALAFVGIAREAGTRVRFQVGEPWWWTNPGGRICLYDDAARARLTLAGPMPVITDVRGPRSAAEIALLDRAGAVLAESTAALTAAVRASALGAETLVLVYLPTVLDADAPEVVRANVPVGWAAPAFDVLQCEDYDWAAEGRTGASGRGLALMRQRLGYGEERQHYLAGFVLRPEDRGQWPAIAAAAERGLRRGVAETFVWALPQVLRDGFTWFEPGSSGGDEAMKAFDDVRFPLSIGRGASVAPTFSTAVVATASGAEQRNADWSNARMRYDAGPGIRSEAELGELLAFFRARRGAARAFRFADPFDGSSNGATGVPGPTDQRIGTGDGATTRFALVKRYGDGADAQVRPVTRPVAGSVRVAVGGAARTGGWRVDGGAVEFDAPPPAGAAVTAGFRFDVPVRFAEDRLEINAAAFAAGEAVSVPLIEVREG